MGHVNFVVGVENNMSPRFFKVFVKTLTNTLNTSLRIKVVQNKIFTH